MSIALICMCVYVDTCIMYRVDLHHPGVFRSSGTRAAAHPQFMKGATAGTCSSPDRAKQNLCLISGFQGGSFGTQRATQQ